jgi:hypothetical protein
MTEVETLLNVDAGRIPPDAVAFFRHNTDADAAAGLSRAALALSIVVVAVAAAALALAIGGTGRLPVTLLGIGAALLALRATPTLRPDRAPAPTRQVMVVTARGLIMRDSWGLRSWRFDDLTTVAPCRARGRAYLMLVERGGREHVIDLFGFQRGEHLRAVIGSRLRAKEDRATYFPSGDGAFTIPP